MYGISWICVSPFTIWNRLGYCTLMHWTQSLRYIGWWGGMILLGPHMKSSGPGQLQKCLGQNVAWLKGNWVCDILLRPHTLIRNDNLSQPTSS